ncbi:MAG: hypothetical protein M1457_01515 [bacterium]|nr:hypothetical protein [bacterium]
MNSRERVFTALRHEEPDRVPFNMRVCGEIVQRLRDWTGDPNVDWHAYFGHDIRPSTGFPIAPCPSGVPVWDWTPSPTAAEIDEAAKAVRRFIEQDFVVASGYQRGIFEEAKRWFGDVDTLTMPYLDPKRFGEMLDRLTQWKMAVYGAWVICGVDVVWIGDDLGTQRSLIMSPADYRYWYRPRHRILIEHLKALGPGVKVAFHCCGHVTPLVRDLIEIGVDILEAVQAETMDIGFLKREFGRDIVFWGGIGAQSVLACRDPADVREGVRKTLAVMAPGGGYIAAPCHTLTEEVNWENVLAYHEAIRCFRDYPDGWRKKESNAVRIMTANS